MDMHRFVGSGATIIGKALDGECILVASSIGQSYLDIYDSSLRWVASRCGADVDMFMSELSETPNMIIQSTEYGRLIYAENDDGYERVIYLSARTSPSTQPHIYVNQHTFIRDDITLCSVPVTLHDLFAMTNRASIIECRERVHLMLMILERYLPDELVISIVSSSCMHFHRREHHLYTIEVDS